MVGGTQHSLISFDVERGEILGELVLGEEDLGVRGSTNTVIEIVSMVGDDDQPPSRSNSCGSDGVNRPAGLRWKLEVGQHHQIPLLAVWIPRGQVHGLESGIEAVFLGDRCRLVDGNRGQLQPGDHVTPAGQPEGVPALPATQIQRPARGEIGGDLDQEPIGVGSPHVILIGVAGIPSGARLVIHGGKVSDVEALRGLAERQPGHVVAIVDGEGTDFVWVGLGVLPECPTLLMKNSDSWSRAAQASKSSVSSVSAL